MIGQQIQTTIAAIVLAVAVVLTGIVAWKITANSYKNDIAEIERKHAGEVVSYERKIGAIQAKAQEDTAAAITRMKDAQNALAELDQQKSKELANAKAENDALMRDVADGTRRVRILQTNLAGCNSGSGTAGGNSSTGSVGDGATVELSKDFGSAILDIRQGIIEDQAKLTYLQTYVRDVVKQCKRM